MKKSAYDDAEIRQCLRMISTGKTSKEVSDHTDISRATILHWMRTYANEIKMLKKRKAGSGVIAPSAYRRGYRWGSSVY